MRRLDPRAQALLDAAAGSPPMWALPVAEARTRMRAIHATGGRDDVAAEDLAVPGPAGGIPVRVYRPDAAPRPVLVFLHGGGWVLDDIDTHELLVGTLAAIGGLIAVSVDYRRAPEHPFPAALDDAIAVVRWAARAMSELGGDGALAVGGDSAGGNLAAATALALRDRGGPHLAAQLLLYPVLDLPSDTGSYHEHATGSSLTRAFMDWAFDAYAPAGVERSDPLLVPARAADLRGLPATWMVTAEFDPLRDEGLAWAGALARSGVAVRTWHADDQTHGFAVRLREIPRAAALVDDVARDLGGYLRRAGATR